MKASRRKLLAAILGMQFLGGTAWWARRSFAALRAPRLDSHAARSVTAIVDRLIPSDDLPGAVALKIDQRILVDPDVQRWLAGGLRWLDAYARQAGAADFRSMDEAGQLNAMTSGWAAYDTAVEQMLSALWYRSATLYYTEPLVQRTYAYAGPPQPEGFADYQQAPH